MSAKTFVGFGFGAVQAGLFLYEAHRSGAFDRLVVAEVLPDVVRAVRKNGGRYAVNIATRTGVEKARVDGVEIFNPAEPEDRARLVEAVAESSEVATALPSVRFYGSHRDAGSVAGIIADGIAAGSGRRIIYAAENDNRAAELLAAALGGPPENTQCLNTVIGKMSSVVADPDRIRAEGLAETAPGLGRCFLVEEFNRILISRVRWPGFDRGIAVFEQKTDLLPFEEAKLYGHNATHALLGYLGRREGCVTIADAGGDPVLMGLARDAFIKESGAALCRRHAGIDALFTPAGYAAYADDLLERMVNPYLRDAVERVVRDPRRKLGWDDRFVGTIRIALEQGIEPWRYAKGAAAALDTLIETEGGEKDRLLDEAWSGAVASNEEKARIKNLILDA